MKIIDGFKLRRIGKEYIVTGEGIGQIDFNKIISLSSSAAWLWEQVEGKDFDAKMLATLLTSRYDVDEQTALNDSVEILDEWIKANLVQ